MSTNPFLPILHHHSTPPPNAPKKKYHDGVFPPESNLRSASCKDACNFFRPSCASCRSETALAPASFASLSALLACAKARSDDCSLPCLLAKSCSNALRFLSHSSIELLNSSARCGLKHAFTLTLYALQVSLRN